MNNLLSNHNACPVCYKYSYFTGIKLGGYKIFKCSCCNLCYALEAFENEFNYDLVYMSEEYQQEQMKMICNPFYDFRNFAEHPTYKPFFRNVKRNVGSRLLDVGCGVGRFCHASHSLGWNVVGIDISERAIEYAKKYAKFPVFNKTLDEMAENSDKFDVITAFEVLEHLSNPMDFLLKIKKILKLRGQIFFTVPNWDCPDVQNATRIDWVPPIHRLFFTQKALEHFIGLAGFHEVKTGFIRTDPLPRGFLNRGKWLARHIIRWQTHPLGLWVHGKLPESLT